MTDEYPPQDEATADQYVDALWERYGPDNIATSEVSIRPDQFDEKTDFVDVMQGATDQLRESRHCEDTVLEFSENTHSHLQYLRCTIHAALADDAPDGWLARQMREITVNIDGDDDD